MFSNSILIGLLHFTYYALVDKDNKKEKHKYFFFSIQWKFTKILTTNNVSYPRNSKLQIRTRSKIRQYLTGI